MLTRPLKIITGLIGVFLIATFVIGLAHSIAVGFAGFWGALPFIVIVAMVLGMVAYDFWDQCMRPKQDRTD